MIEVDLGDGVVALIDDDDAALVDGYRWYPYQNHGNVYVVRYETGTDKTVRRIYLHREIMGETDPDVLIDHVNGSGLDNQRENLRRATIAENNRNRKRRRDATSGYKGVCYDKRRQKWTARIHANGGRIWLGAHATAAAAARAYNEAAHIYHGDFASPNQIMETSET